MANPYRGQSGTRVSAGEPIAKAKPAPTKRTPVHATVQVETESLSKLPRKGLPPKQSITKAPK